MPARWTLLLALFATCSVTVRAAADESGIDAMIREASTTNGAVVVASHTDYAEALKVALKARDLLHYKLDLRGLKLHPKHGLTLSRSHCGSDYPCAPERGLIDDGRFISVERSDSYNNFKPGYFIVMIDSGLANSPSLKASLEAAKASFPDAFLRIYSVYHGCRH